jgi:hypothetical protein
MLELSHSTTVLMDPIKTTSLPCAVSILTRLENRDVYKYEYVHVFPP